MNISMLLVGYIKRKLRTTLITFAKMLHISGVRVSPEQRIMLAETLTDTLKI